MKSPSSLVIHRLPFLKCNRLDPFPYSEEEDYDRKQTIVVVIGMC